MTIKLMILLAFASLVHGVYVPSLKVNYGLSKDQANILEKIMLSQELTITTCSKAFETLFGTIFNFEHETKHHRSLISEALLEVKCAMNMTLDPDVLALGSKCAPAVEIARKAAHADFDDAFWRISVSLKLVGSCNYLETKAAIERHHAAAQKNYESLVRIDYDLILNFLNTTDPEILAVINIAKKESLASALRLINAVFNAIKLYAAVIPVPCGDAAFASDIEELKSKISANTRTYVTYKFGTLRTLFIIRCLNQRGIVSGVFQSQYTEIASFFIYMKGNKDVFDVGKDYLRRLDLGLSDDNDPSAFSAVNVSFARIIADFSTGDGIFLDLIQFVHPDLSAKITAAREFFHESHTEAYIACVEAFDVAVAKGISRSKTLATIAALSNATVPPSPALTKYVFDLIRNNRTFDRKTEAELNSLQNLTDNGLAVNTAKFFDAAVVLAKARLAGEVSKKDYRAIEILLDEANKALEGFTQGITAACLSVYRCIVREKLGKN